MFAVQAEGGGEHRRGYEEVSGEWSKSRVDTEHIKALVREKASESQILSHKRKEEREGS